jgi:hypothetical protein
VSAPSSPRAAALGAWLRRVADVRRPPPRARRWLLLAGAALFLGGAAFAVRDLDLPPGGVRLAPVLVVAVVLVPLTIAVNAVELVALGRLLGQRLGAATAVRVVVLGTAANLLPLPGAAALRIQALAGGGASYAAATGVNLAAAFAWLGAAAAVGGGALATEGRGPLGLTVAAAGLAALAGAMLVAWRLATVARPGRPLALLVAAEVATVVVHALRLVLLLGAIGAATSFAAGTVVGTSGPLAAAAGVFPAGLGVAEALAAGAGALVGVPAAAAFAAAALNRLVGYGVLAVVVAVPALRRPPADVAGSPEPEPEPEPGTDPGAPRDGVSPPTGGPRP